MEFLEEKGRIYAVDANGKLLAEVTFPDDGNTAVIDHTLSLIHISALFPPW